MKLLVLFLLLITLKSSEISCGINLDLGFKLPSINIRLEPKLPTLKITTLIKAKKSSESGLLLSTTKAKNNWDDQSSWIEDSLDKTFEDPWPSSEPIHTLVEKDYDISPEPWQEEDWDRGTYWTDNTNTNNNNNYNNYNYAKSNNNSYLPWPYPPSALPWAPWGFYPVAIIPYPFQPMVTTTATPNDEVESNDDENEEEKKKRRPRASTRAKIATAKFH